MKKFVLLCAALFLSAAQANKLLDRDDFPSGFKASERCELRLTNALWSLAEPVRKFKDLSLAGRVKYIHEITHRSRARESIDPQHMTALAVRLRFLADESMRKLEPFANELNVIAIELSAFLQNDRFPKQALDGFEEYVEAILHLDPGSEQGDLMVHAGAHAVLAEIKVARLGFASARRKAQLVEEFTQAMQKTAAANLKAGGMIGPSTLVTPLRALKLVMAQFDLFDVNHKPAIRKWITVVTRAAFDQPEEVFLKLGHPLPAEFADAILAIYQMPELQRFPEVAARAEGFFKLLSALAEQKRN